MTEREELKPCPFCGDGQNVTIENYDDSYWMMCRGCHAEGPVRKGDISAEKAWNRRAEG